MHDRLGQKAAINLMIRSQEHELNLRGQELGKIGVWFGSRENAALYFAVMVIFLTLMGAGILGVAEPTLRPDLMKLFTVVAVAALGFVGGLLTK